MNVYNVTLNNYFVSIYVNNIFFYINLYHLLLNWLTIEHHFCLFNSYLN